MSVEYKGLTNILEIDSHILKYLNVPNLLACSEVNKYLKEIARSLFGPLARRDFGRYLDQKIITKVDKDLNFNDYRALYLFRKNLIRKNIENDHYAIESSPATHRFFNKFKCHPSHKSFHGDSAAYYCENEQDEGGKVTVFKLNGTSYEFFYPLTPSKIFVSGYTVFILQKETKPTKYTLRLYICQNSYEITMPFQVDDEIFCWLSNDHLIVEINSRELEIISPFGDRKGLYKCEGNYLIRTRKILDEKNFLIEIASFNKPKLCIVFHKNQFHLSFDKDELFQPNQSNPDRYFCGYYENGDFWAIVRDGKTLDARTINGHSVQTQSIILNQPISRIFTCVTPSKVFTLNYDKKSCRTCIKCHPMRDRTITIYDGIDEEARYVQDICVLGKTLMFLLAHSFPKEIYSPKIAISNFINSSHCFKKIEMNWESIQMPIQDFGLVINANRLIPANAFKLQNEGYFRNATYIINDFQFLDYSLTPAELLLSYGNSNDTRNEFFRKLPKTVQSKIGITFRFNAEEINREYIQDILPK